MRRFKWIDWNLQKIATHGLSAAEVEAAFGRAATVQSRSDGSFRMTATTPSGRRIVVIWRYDRGGVEPNIFADIDDVPTFVITAF